MAAMVVNEMERIGIEQGMRSVEQGMRELLREGGAEALGRYLERVDDRQEERVVECKFWGMEGRLVNLSLRYSANNDLTKTIIAQPL